MFVSSIGLAAHLSTRLDVRWNFSPAQRLIPCVYLTERVSFHTAIVRGNINMKLRILKLSVPNLVSRVGFCPLYWLLLDYPSSPLSFL